MFQWLQDIFVRLSDFFSAIWDFIQLAISKIIEFFQVVAKALTFGYEVITALPTFYLVFGILMLSVLIIYVILGRSAGGD